MYKKEGILLKNAIRDAGYSVQEFAEKIGYTHRTALLYHFKKERLDFDIKEKSANALGKTIDELFNENEQKSSQDIEKNLLIELAASRKKTIEDRDKYADVYQTIINKLINNEAWAQVIVHRLADLTQLLMGDRVDKKMIEAQSNEEVEMISRELLKRLKDES